MTATNEMLTKTVVICAVLSIAKAIFALESSVASADELFILNGELAPETPHHAHLIIREEKGSVGSFIGSGFLISDRHVLTCGQNIFGFTFFRVGLGNTRRRELTFYETSTRILHDDYDPDDLSNNIGLIILQNAVTFTSGIQAIALPPADLAIPYSFEQGVISGFGFTGSGFAWNLMRGFQRVLTREECIARFPHLQPNMLQHFCARDASTSSNICSGDQGTAFAVLVRNAWTAVGIASFTERSCIGELGAAYIRVSAYRQWIETNAGV